MASPHGRGAGVVPLFQLKTTSEVRPEGATLGDLVEWFKADVLPNPHFAIRPNTARNYRRTFELALSWFGPYPSQDEVIKWTMVLSLPPYGFGRRTVHHHWKNLRALFRYGIDAGKVRGNPCALMRFAAPEAASRPIMNIREVWPLLLDVCRDERERAFIGVQRFAGVRLGEALGLQVDDVNMFAAPWQLEVQRQRSPQTWEAAQTKSEHALRCIEVRPELRELLAGVLALPRAVVRTGLGGGGRREVGYLFPFRKEHLLDFMTRLRTVAPLAFPTGKAWHVFRDTLAVELYRAGVPLSDIARILGHSSEAVTMAAYVQSAGRRHRPGVFDVLYRGAPPGAGPPPDFPAAESGTATPARAAVPRRSKEQSPTVKQENTPCRTPTRDDSSQQGRSAGTTGGRSRSNSAPSSSRSGSAATSATPKPSSRRSGPSPSPRPPAPTPATSPSRVQRALPGLSVGPVTRRPRR